MTYDDIGEVLGLTGERVRQIAVGALARLRRSRTLRELWEEHTEPRPLNGTDGNTWKRARL
jgi:DNA-directed RNA polymerase sigma subunit (sigma70/sigma32)